MSLSTLRTQVERIIADHEAKDKAKSEINHSYGIVIYTDGGGDNNTQGPCGAGAHGYLFDYAVGKVVSFLPTAQVPTNAGYYDTSLIDRKPKGDDVTETEYTNTLQFADGSAKFKKKQVKLVRVQPIAYFDMAKYLPRPSTSNRAELDGLIMALQATVALKGLITSAHYRLDSTYTINGMSQFIDGWKKNNWRGTGSELKNVDMWKSVSVLRDEIMIEVTNGLTVSIEHVKGHTEWYGNIAADKLTHKARVADTLTEANFRVEAAPTYFKAANTPNKFLTMPRWYYCTNDHQVINGKSVYYIGRHGKEELDVAVGSRMNEQSYAVVLTDDDPVLAKLREHYEEVAKGYKEDLIYFTYVDNVFNSKTYDDLAENHLLYTRLTKKKCTSSDKTTLFVNANPVNTAYVAFDHFKAIERKLFDYLEDKLPGNHAITDITDFIYGTKKVKDKDVLITLPDEDASLVIPAKHRMKSDEEYQTHKVILTRGLDIPRRSLFLGIVDDNPKVYLLTWHESRTKFRFATIVRTDKGDVGIWVGLFSDQKIKVS